MAAVRRLVAAARSSAFVLFIVAAITDYCDGQLARTRKQVTDLGKLLDPLADKLLLVGTFVPMYLLMRPPRARPAQTLARPRRRHGVLPVHHAVRRVGLPLWIVLVVLGRELFMTLFRQVAARRGVVIAAIGPAKWKTGFQSIWVGAAYFWFFAATLAAATRDWTRRPRGTHFAISTASSATLSMIGAVGSRCIRSGCTCAATAASSLAPPARRVARARRVHAHRSRHDRRRAAARLHASTPTPRTWRASSPSLGIADRSPHDGRRRARRDRRARSARRSIAPVP